jgi:hypothetical protein
VALPPRIQQFGQRRAVLPIDPVSGGTWVAGNDAGLAMTVLNVNQEGRKKGTTSLPRSRGMIIPSLLHSDTLTSALSQATGLEQTRYAPFRLVLADRKEWAEVRSDGQRLKLMSRTAIVEPVFFTSSGLGDHLVEEPRRRLFVEFFNSAGDPVARQEAFHRHYWPDRPHLSVCMRRVEARTVSYTIVSLGQDMVTLTYHADAPDQPAETVLVDRHYKVRPGCRTGSGCRHVRSGSQDLLHTSSFPDGGIL